MKIELFEPAEKELNDAIDYYNQPSPGLGFEFALEIKRALERIRHYPDAWTFLSRRTRRCLTNQFPYGVIYQILKFESMYFQLLKRANEQAVVRTHPNLNNAVHT